MPDVNWLAVVAAAVTTFLLGGLWYSPALFLKPWEKAAGRNVTEKEPHPARVFGISFVFSLIAAGMFAVWLGPAPDLAFATLRGLAAGSCFVAASFGINYQFANRSMILWLIDGGYHVVQFTLFGVVLGLWH